jgi:5'-nucleotidase
VYAVSGSPAQAVQHGVLEIMPKKPDLVVSGINYGENVGLGTTISGTVGAAMEAASLGIPALAISLEAAQRFHLSYSQEVDFSVAAHFASYFGRLLLGRKMPEDVHVLKVDVPSDATPETPWVVTRVARQGYYEPVAPRRQSWSQSGHLGYKEAAILDGEGEDSDVVVLRKKHMIAVTPISLDMTSRVELKDLEKRLRA